MEVPFSATRCALAAGLACFMGLTPSGSQAQQPGEQPDAAMILHRMQKLQVVGSVLYIAAHPDDENTRLITWLGNGMKLRTAYLSLTRGDGGQNLIGPELGDALGVIRTEELLAARRIDGGEQFFTRAVDFGFSKNAAETFGKWGKEAVLGDVVRVIRRFRPDVVITRFPPTREAGHGHHEASAMLAQEAFDLAGDPNAYPEQLAQGLQPWQPRRLFFNGSTWWRKDLAEVARKDSGWYTVDVGGYDPLLGQSYTEIAARSRSMHKSQGFGAAETRGESLEYLKFLKGDRPKGSNLFGGMDLTWGRMQGGQSVQNALDKLLAGYDLRKPEQSVPQLEQVATAMDALPESPWKHYARPLVDQLLLAATGTVLEALAEVPHVVAGDTVHATLHLLTRSTARITCQTPGCGTTPLPANQVLRIPTYLVAPLVPDQPYWLKEPHGNLFSVQDSALIGMPEAPDALQAPYALRFAGGTVVKGMAPVLYRTVDRVKGDVVQPCEVVPPASLFANPGLLMVTGDSAQTQVTVEAFTHLGHAELTCEQVAGWDIAPPRQDLGALKAGEFRSARLTVKAGDRPERNGPYMHVADGHPGPGDLTRHVIRYDHIPQRSWYTPASFRIQPLHAKVNAKRVGYIMGAGDNVPQALEQLGVAVDVLDPATLLLRTGEAGTAAGTFLKPYDAIVTGIRAYNTVGALKEMNPVLMQYVKEGGTLVVQYTTLSNDMVLPDSLIGPYPFHLTRGRVTEEDAPPTFPNPKHALLNTPNKITAADFEGWVQERGLYFPGALDPHYTPLITWNDAGEPPLNGALVACDYGKGRYVYTGISFFRQLPAGVPGAYRLFANLISRR